MSPARKKSARKKPTARRSQAATKTSKKTRARKPAGSAKRKTSIKKTTRKKTAAKRKTSIKKTTRKKTAKKRTAIKKTTRNKTAAQKKTPVKKTSARNSTAKKSTSKKRSGTRAATLKPPSRRPSRSEAAKPTAKKAPRRRAAKFDKGQLAAIRTELESERSGLQAQLDELTQDSFDGTQSELTGEVGIDDDFADAGSATFERERDLSIQNNIRDLIDQTTRAIQRIDDGNYGTCERCGNPIEAARLKALPHALLCMDCKRREERAR